MVDYYLAFYKGRKEENPNTSFFDRVVCFFTNSRYSHVEFVTHLAAPDQIYSDCYASSPRDGGVRRASINLRNGNWEVYEMPSFLRERYVDEFFHKKFGAGYDWLGAIGTTVRIFKQENQRWFCSEIIADLLGYGDPHLYTPEDLFRALKPYMKRVI